MSIGMEAATQTVWFLIQILSTKPRITVIIPAALANSCTGIQAAKLDVISLLKTVPLVQVLTVTSLVPHKLTTSIGTEPVMLLVQIIMFLELKMAVISAIIPVMSMISHIGIALVRLIAPHHCQLESRLEKNIATICALELERDFFGMEPAALSVILLFKLLPSKVKISANSHV